jgi:lactoylglutathione lyase
MGFVLAIAEDQVPSTGEPDPYMHVFLDAGAGNILAFFELPTRPPMGRDPNTPAWTQHLALEVATVADLLDVKASLEADGIEVVGPTDHKLFQSIYFFDPSGHRVELAANTATAAMTQRLDGSSGRCWMSSTSASGHRDMRAGCTTAATPNTNP